MESDVKKQLYEVMDRIEYLQNTPLPLTDAEDLELRNLEEKKWQLWSDLKDGNLWKTFGR